MIWSLIAVLAVACCWWMGWAICRAAARADADEAQRELLALLAEQVGQRERDSDDRDIAANLDI